MTRVRLPAGCTGLDMANGVKYTAEKPGGTVDVTSKDAHFIDTSWYGQGQAGIIRGGPAFTLGTRAGRWCRPCKRLWQAWSKRCPRCGTGTVPEPTALPQARANESVEIQVAHRRTWDSAAHRSPSRLNLP